MEIIQGFSTTTFIDNAYISIGIYDGVHTGHQAVLKTLVNDARAGNGVSCIITFHPHPVRVLRMGYNPPPQITSTVHKMRLLAQLGIDYCFIIEFNNRFAKISPETFFESILATHFNIKELCVGYDCSFGKDKSGSLNLLRKMSKERDFILKVIDPVKIDDIVVSSSMIRKLIIAGELELVKLMTGRPYSLWGTVVAGNTFGRKIGYPTANLDPHHEALPPSGVYIVNVQLEGKSYQGLMNIGYRPTFFDKYGYEEIIEVHILDFNKNIYGKDMEIIFLKKIRDEKRFSTTQSLIRQIKQDEREAKKYFGKLT